jgi:hypothetical protein
MTIAEGQRKWWILAAMIGEPGLVVLDETRWSAGRSSAPCVPSPATTRVYFP